MAYGLFAALIMGGIMIWQAGVDQERTYEAVKLLTNCRFFAIL